MKKTILKLIGYLLVLGLIIWAFKQVDIDPLLIEQSDTIGDMSNDDDLYFVGSSRVMASVDPKIIESITGQKTFNVAISGSTFLSNCILAEYLLKQKNRKTVFIELSPIKYQIPKGLVSFTQHTGLDLTESMLKFSGEGSLFEQMNMISLLIIQQLSILEEVKWILGKPYRLLKNLEESDHISFGYTPYDGNQYRKLDTFIEKSDLELRGDYSQVYDSYLAYLQKKAALTNSRIVFFLPVSFRLEQEKQITIPFYNALPDSSKLIYSSNFINSIRKSDYLRDMNHLNKKGAEVYSKLLGEEIARMINSPQY